MTTHSRGARDQWHDRALAALDFETTGTDPWVDRIVSYAIVDDRGVRSELVDPDVPVPAAAVAVHGLDTAALHGAQASALAVAHVLAWLEHVIEWRLPLVVFNAPYDLTMLVAEARRFGFSEPDWSRLLVVDPMVIDWAVDRERRGQRRLGDVAEHYGVPLGRAHDAACDAVAALEVARAIGARHPEVGAISPDELVVRQTEWFAERADGWNAWARENDRGTADPRGWPLALPLGRRVRQLL